MSFVGAVHWPNRRLQNNCRDGGQRIMAIETNYTEQLLSRAEVPSQEG